MLPSKYMAQLRPCLITILLMAASHTTAQPGEQTAEDLWTTGDLLHAVQLAPLYNDSKTFVDQPILASQEEVQNSFQQLQDENGGNISTAQLSAFVDQYFGAAGSDLEQYSPPDYSPDLGSDWLPLVSDPAIRQWALDVNGLWAYLSRVENASVAENPEQHSLLTLPDPGVVAGDRFREVYYWDSYWIILGLLTSRMTETATRVVSNLVALLQEYGHVPNGARTYYLNRSQPPLLSQMVRAVFNATGDDSLLATAWQPLLQEHAYWTSDPKTITIRLPAGSFPEGSTYNFSRYYAEWDQPRPESYLEDAQTAEGLDAEASAALWNNIASGAESGMDFSSRWFADGSNMSTIRTTQLIPTDLNAYLYQMEENLAFMAEQLGYEEAAATFQQSAAERKAAFNAVLYDAASGCWRDQAVTSTDAQGISSIETSSPRPYVSNYIPLWAGLMEGDSEASTAVLRSFLASGLVQQAGVSTSLVNSGQQWDAPNAWPPLQWIMIQAMQANGMEDRAAALAQTWLANNWAGWQETGKMVEKYSAQSSGLAGGGGEYSVQTGFGWTNGVMLSLLEQYGWNPAAAPAPAPAASAT